MPAANKLVKSIVSHGPTLRRYAFIVSLLGGLLFCGLGYFMGRAHWRLVSKGLKTEGIIVDFRTEHISTRRSDGTTRTSDASMAVVEYRANGDKKVRFEDWLDDHKARKQNEVVPVLYDPANPSVAMIDRPLWNWIPWAPTFAAGVLLILSALRRGLLLILVSARSRRSE